MPVDSLAFTCCGAKARFKRDAEVNIGNLSAHMADGFILLMEMARCRAFDLFGFTWDAREHWRHT